MIVRHPPTVAAIRDNAIMLSESPRDYDPLLHLAKDRSFVLLGEATHGTHEFYAMRAAITRRLIQELGFDAVAVEGDWPDVYRLNRYVHGTGPASLDDAFDDFQRFPAWMWRNHDVQAFIQWLHAYNAIAPEVTQVGIYGLDLYSLYRSAEAVIDYLERMDPEQASVARKLYAGLDEVQDPQEYGYEAASGLRPSCSEAAEAMLVDLLRKGPGYLSADGKKAQDEQFFVERNAYVVLHAERYYRTMFAGRVNSWNLRDAHMVDTLVALRRHLRSKGREGRIVVWAHNSHLGDARATQMGARGEMNIGEMVREQVGQSQCLLVGFTTYTGHVTAARDWDAPAERRWVRPARKDSYEHLFYTTRMDRFFLPLHADSAASLASPLLERAIGVIYKPESELESHYFAASLGAQFDAVFHLDETTAVEPLDASEHWTRREPAHTYPFGL